MDGFAAQHRNVLVVSALGHVLLLLALSANLLTLSKPPLTRLAIEAVIVDQNALKRSTEADRLKTEQAEQRKREEVARQKRQQETQQQEQQAAEQRKQQQAEAERRSIDQQRKEADAKAAAEQQRKEADAKAAAEQQRKKAEADRKVQEQRQAEARANAEKERVAAAAKAKADADKRDQARRQAELMASMEAEENLNAAQASGDQARYIALVKQKIERNWIPPATVQKGLECELLVSQLPNGEVVEVRTGQCNGDAAVRRSVENAVLRASPLPLPDNRTVFDRNLRFIFKPEQ